MIKRTVAIILCYCLVSFAETVTINSASQLIEWFNTHSGETSQVVLELAADIDFHKSGLKYPLGVSQGSCNPFSGSFKGREHTIKRLVMNNKNDNTYSSAGLFCGLKGAIVDDLVIDESCKFTGSSAGALSVKITGENTVSLLNIQNKAQVNGEHGVGGLIGVVDKKVSGKILLQRCKNTGSVTAKENDAGGFIGHIENSKTDVEFQNTTNTGVINGAQIAGGYVGFIKNNDILRITVNDSVNLNNVEGKNYASAFLGYAEEALTGRQTITISNNVNKGAVKGTEMACGFFCSDESDTSFSEVYNNINYGEVSGSIAYGFAPAVTNAENDVNLGIINGIDYSASFWKTVQEFNTIVTTQELCKNCDGAVWMTKNADGIYDVVRTKMHVYDMLNWNVVREQRWKLILFWNSKLEFKETDDYLNIGHSLTVTFSAISLVFLMMVHGVFSQ